MEKAPSFDGAFFVYVWSFHPILHVECVERVDGMQSFRRLVLREDTSPDPIIVAVRDLCARMDAVQMRFQMETDPDLIEGCIYELESLRAQYRYLLRTARKEGITCQEKAHLWGE